ncbi:hypothetical protein [Phytohabitans kaempferiae]|uniref:Uncharacterized protein n=1 Tax=Phytohabitans kaempferiae TaxID=1620943 RepID=A0ABV6MI30_9ACTN
MDDDFDLRAGAPRRGTSRVVISGVIGMAVGDIRAAPLVAVRGRATRDGAAPPSLPAAPPSALGRGRARCGMAGEAC